LINIYDIEKDELVFSNADQKKFLKNFNYPTEGKGFKAKLESLVLSDDLEKLGKSWENYKVLNSVNYEELYYRLIDNNNRIIKLYSRRIPFKIENGEVRQVLMNEIKISDQNEHILEL